MSNEPQDAATTEDTTERTYVTIAISPEVRAAARRARRIKNGKLAEQNQADQPSQAFYDWAIMEAIKPLLEPPVS